MKNLDEQCQAVWNEPSLEGKRTAVKVMINAFDHKGKSVKYLEQVETMKPYELDNLAKDLMLRDKDRVIKI